MKRYIELCGPYFSVWEGEDLVGIYEDYERAFQVKNHWDADQPVWDCLWSAEPDWIEASRASQAQTAYARSLLI